MAHFVDSGNTRLGLFVLVVFDMFLVWGELLLIFTACAPCEAAARAGLALEHHDGDELGHDAAGAHEAHAAHSHNVHGLSPKQMVWEHGMHRISNLILFTLAGHLLLSFAAYGGQRRRARAPLAPRRSPIGTHTRSAECKCSCTPVRPTPVH